MKAACRLVSYIASFLLLLSGIEPAFAQPPVISYQTPQTYTTNTSITPLRPVNTGGIVPATIYGQVSTFAGSGTAGATNGPGTAASFSYPSGLATDAAGNLYVSDYGNQLIRKITPNSVVSTFAGNGTSGNTNGAGTAASFSNPIDLTADAAGNLYVSDAQNYIIRMVTPAAVVSTYAGNGTQGDMNGLAAASSFGYPWGGVFDGQGNLFVADYQNHIIRKISPAGIVSTFAGSGNAAAADGQGTAASFQNPIGLCIDAIGNLFVADAGNSLIRKITPTGLVSTVAGTGHRGYDNGPALSASINEPNGIVIDPTGNIYFADQNNNVIRLLNNQNIISTLAGNGNAGKVNGLPTNASFNVPSGLVFDNAGNLVVADFANNIIRKITVTGYTINKPLPAGLTFDQMTGTISGTPTSTSPATDYTITAYNGGGSSSAIVNIQVNNATVIQSVITFPILQTKDVCDADFSVDATSNNTTIPLSYNSSNLAVATISQDGTVHIVGPGTTTITVSQSGNTLYTAAQPQSQVLTVTGALAPAVTIVSSVTFPVCVGTPVTFSARAINYITPPSYQWQLNGMNVGMNSLQFSSSTLNDGDLITCTIATTGSCTLTATAVSNGITAIIIPGAAPVPSISISPDFYDSCEGISLTYTATAINAGTTPAYQWIVNGVNAGTNQNTFTSSTLQTGDKIICTVTNTTPCSFATATSNAVSLSASPNISNTVTITSPAANKTLSPGETATFTATTAYSTNATLQTTVDYQWTVNNINAGTDSPVFSNSTLKNGDVVSCIVTTTGKCIVTPNITSNNITVIVVTPLIVPHAFTPNGDGVNDTWNIPALAAYPGNTVNIFNRYGTPVFQSNGYSHPWDGTFNGAALPVGTYYYIIDPKNGDPKIAGYVALIR